MVLGSAEIEFIFSIVAGMVPSFGFSRKIIFIMHQHFSCFRAVLILSLY